VCIIAYVHSNILMFLSARSSRQVRLPPLPMPNKRDAAQ